MREARREGPGSGGIYRRYLDQISAIPGVERAAVADGPLPGAAGTEFSIIGRGDDAATLSQQHASWRIVSPQYFDVLRIPILAGRAFTDSDTGDRQRVAIVNEEMARRFWPGQDPIGQQISFSRTPDWVTVIGVVGATRHRGLDEDLRSEVYRPASQHEGMSTFVYALRTATDPAAFAPAIRQAVQQLDANLPVLELKTMDELIAATADRRPSPDGSGSDN